MSPARTISSLLCVAAMALASCSKRAEPKSEARSETKVIAEAPLTPRPWRLPAVDRLVAIGDLHGDLEATRRALRLAGAIDGGDHWVGGQLVVVQTGDQLDRGDQDREILDLFSRLSQEARAAGGDFHPLNGNHETMNVQSDFRYVTPAGFLQFKEEQPAPQKRSFVGRFIPTARGRAAAFTPGGDYARKLAERPVVLMIGDSVFVHGGVLRAHVDADIGRLNEETRLWMLGKRSSAPALIDSADGPVWTRAYGEPTPPAAACAELERTLEALHAARMVVGHTVQDKGISGACGDKVWRIDVGLAAYYGPRPTELLEIGKTGVRVLREPERAALNPKAASGF